MSPFELCTDHSMQAANAEIADVPIVVLCASAAHVSVVSALVEGSSINATSRMTGVAKHTILKLLAQHAKMFLKVFEANLKKYEDKFGEIKLPPEIQELEPETTRP